MTEWQNAISRHSTRIDPSFQQEVFSFVQSLSMSTLPCLILCVYILQSPRYLPMYLAPNMIPSNSVTGSSRFPENPFSPARLGPAVDSVQQSSTYRPTCQDASSALTAGQTREKAWTGWRQIFPKWLSQITGIYFWYFHAGIRNWEFYTIMMRWACHPNAGKSYIFEDFEEFVDHSADRMNIFATAGWTTTIYWM